MRFASKHQIAERKPKKKELPKKSLDLPKKVGKQPF